MQQEDQEKERIPTFKNISINESLQRNFLPVHSYTLKSREKVGLFAGRDDF